MTLNGLCLVCDILINRKDVLIRVCYGSAGLVSRGNLMCEVSLLEVVIME